MEIQDNQKYYEKRFQEYMDTCNKIREISSEDYLSEKDKQILECYIAIRENQVNELNRMFNDSMEISFRGLSK